MGIKTITLALPFRMGQVNCYLLKSSSGYVLIDTGCSNKRKEIEKQLLDAGCRQGELKLIIITHGDFDHTGNAAYLRNKFRSRIAMHTDDAVMAERGDMFCNRKKGNMVIGAVSSLLFKFGKADRFKPDVYLDEDSRLDEYGLDAAILHIPGHSPGSIGVLMPDDTLFCGDLLVHDKQPRLNTIIDDLETAKASVERLKGLAAGTVYPGHGKPFRMDVLGNDI